MIAKAQLVPGWTRRLAACDPFMTLLAIGEDDARQFKHGWPAQTFLDKPVPRFTPLVTWEQSMDSPIGETPYWVQLVTNIWVWRPNLPVLEAVHAAMLDAFGGEEEIVAWEDPYTHEWMDCRFMGSTDPSSKYNRRRSVWEVSPR